MAIPFGSLGGLGGMGASYPTRPAPPTSTTVDYMPDAATWLADWQSRYNAEEARRGQGARAAGPSREAYLRDQIGNWGGGGKLTWQGGKDVSAMTDHFLGGESYSTAGRGTETQVLRELMGNSLYNKLAGYKPDPGSRGYVPNFTALNAEKAKMQPGFEAQTANTQAYENLLGNGMLGGILTDGYELPDFSQVTGDFGQIDAGKGQNTGVDMGWTDGAYRPGTAQSGVYAPNPYNTIRWGL